MAERVLPTGTLTFLFTDLEGSTRLLHELGDRYGELLETHRQLIRDAVTAHGGVEFGTGGDAVFIAFETSTAAVAAAADAQRALCAYPWPANVAMKVRMALHTGEAHIVDDDYVGAALHVVARLCAAGHGGQVLLSDATYALARHAPVLALGVHRLRDVPDAMEIYQLCGDGLEQEFSPLRTLTELPNNLPAARDRVIGRELDILEVAEALNAHRLVTLVGSGGAGKTRLALEVAGGLLGEFPDGTWFVPLAAATAPDQVEALTAKALHVGERGAEPLTATLHARLAGSHLLLILDNCEHLIDAVAEFVDGLLARSSRLRVLATSRELLGVGGEQAIAVRPLAVGNADVPGEAVALFIERASAVVPDFDAATEELALVAEVCQRLDGLPLAIELAAARLRSMSLRQLADRLDDRFRLLARGARTAAARQRTLEAVVGWSYDLLEEHERAGFRRLAIFADGFTLDAAEVVAGWGAVPPSAAVDIVSRLVDKSLLVPVRVGDDYRYQLLETLRHYGRERLAHAGEYDECVRHLHSWAREWVERLELDMRTPRQDASLAAAAHERENLRAVYEQAREAGDFDLALRIVTFAPTMSMRDRRAVIDELLAQPWTVAPALRGHALTSHALFSFRVAMPEPGIAAAQEAAEIFGQLGDGRLVAWARYYEMFCAWGFRPDAEVRAHVNELIVEFRALDEMLGLAYGLWVASQLELDIELAISQAAEAEALFRRIESPFGLAHSLEGRALICLRSNDSTRAARYLSEALQLLANADDRGCAAHVLEATAMLLARLELRADARELLGAAEELRRDSGEAHRPWELRSREVAERLLASDDIDSAQTAGRGLDFATATARATRLLEAVHAPT